MGEGGAIPPGAVIAAAVEDAISPLGHVVITRLPLTPEPRPGLHGRGEKPRRRAMSTVALIQLSAQVPVGSDDAIDLATERMNSARSPLT